MKPINELRIAICNDHAGYELKEKVVAYLQQKTPAKLKDFGCMSALSCDYPDFAHPCAIALENNEFDFAISICGSGNGISMVMNKHQHIRAALCWNEEITTLARQHNDANVLSLPGRFIDTPTALRMIDIFFDTDFDGGRHQRRIEKIPISTEK